MSPRFVYLYFMRDDPEAIRATVPRHFTHRQELRLADYLAGPSRTKPEG
jgi:hypothetical protein